MALSATGKVLGRAESGDFSHFARSVNPRLTSDESVYNPPAPGTAGCRR